MILPGNISLRWRLPVSLSITLRLINLDANQIYLLRERDLGRKGVKLQVVGNNIFSFQVVKGRTGYVHGIENRFFVFLYFGSFLSSFLALSGHLDRCLFNLKLFI